MPSKCSRARPIGIDHVVTGGADRRGAVGGHRVADGGRSVAGRRAPAVARRPDWPAACSGLAPDRIEDPLAADDGRAAGFARRVGQEAGQTQEAPSMVGGVHDALKARCPSEPSSRRARQASHRRSSVGGQEVGEGEILCKNSEKYSSISRCIEAARSAHQAGNRVVLATWSARRRLPNHCAGEVLARACRRARPSSMRSTCGVERGRLEKLAALGVRKQRVVRHAAPQRVGEAAGELVGATRRARSCPSGSRSNSMR